jgi:uncharacterized Zn-binding protein involved in type VI secretion
MPLIARKVGSGDTVNTVHDICIVPGTILTETGSSDVFVVDHGVHRFGDLNEAHTHCPPIYSTDIISASPDVFANDKAVARVGDVYSCDAVVEAVTQTTVFAN